ncbi:MAG: hypothetical protein LC122_14175 [Chitinophagales bacterium]|nr:hypothetical protein [Chitinophagales bacterium]
MITYDEYDDIFYLTEEEKIESDEWGKEIYPYKNKNDAERRIKFYEIHDERGGFAVAKKQNSYYVVNRCYYEDEIKRRISNVSLTKAPA